MKLISIGFFTGMTITSIVLYFTGNLDGNGLAFNLCFATIIASVLFSVSRKTSVDSYL